MASGEDRDGVRKQQLSQDFAQQIKQLEQEGQKLMAATQALQTSLTMSPTGKSISAGSLRVSSPLNIASGLSALTDITEEQQTISRLSESLDASTRETENLRQHLRGSQPAPYSSPMTSRYNPNLLSSLEVPDSSYHAGFHTSTPMSVRNKYVPHFEGANRLEATRSYSDLPLQSHKDQQLREAQEEATDMRTKVREAIRIAEEQKNQFRVSIDELKTQLHQAVRDKENILLTKTKELRAHEATIQRQQNSITQLEQANKIQEETLLEMNGKLDALHHDHYAMDALFAQVRTMILDREQKRGRPFYERESALKQTPSLLAHSLERCLQEMEFEIAEKSRRLSEVTIELEEYKASWQERQQLLSQEQQDKLFLQKDNHDRELKSSTEHLQAARRQVAALQDELVTMKEEYEAAIREKNEMLRKNRSNLEKAMDEKNDEIAKWKEKMSAQEMAMDQIEKEMTFCKCERDEAVSKLAALESKFGEMKQLLAKLESQLEMEREQSRKLADQESESNKQLQITATQLEAKLKEVGELKESIGVMKHEFDKQLQLTLRSLTEEQKEKSSQRLIDMSRQTADATEKYQDAKLQLEVLKAEHRNLTEQHQNLVNQSEGVSSQLEEMRIAKERLSATLQERLADVERLTQERDTYFKLLGEKEKELLIMRGETEKLQMQLDDKIVQVKNISDQNNKATELHRSLEKQLKTSQDEQEKLTQSVHQLQLEKQEILNSRDNIIKRLKLREKHLKDIEDDNRQMAAQISDFKQEIEVLRKEKSHSDAELAAVQKSTGELQAAKKKLEKNLQHEHDSHKREIKKLNAKLQAMEEELKMAQKALKTQKDVDGRAVKVAGKMQKEVTEKRSQIDSLNSKVRWLEESLDNILKSKEGAAEQIDALTDKLTASKQQQEKLKYEIDDLHKQNSQLRDKLMRMESALEKAAVKHAETKAQLESYQQEVARLKLKHQLEMKELSRNGQLRHADSRKTLFPANINVMTPNHTPKNCDVSAVEEYPMKDKPLNTQVQNYMVENAVGQELRGLLSEMRDLLYDHKQQQNTPSPKCIPRRDNGGHFLDARSDADLDVNPTARTSRITDKSRHEYSPNARNSSSTSRRAQPVKPVHPLYGEDSVSISDIVEEKDDNDPDLIKRTASAGKSEELYKRLEGKMANLAELGSHLQRENLEIHNIILSSEEKLEKLRHQDKKT